MDNRFQDIHICNKLKKQEFVYRQIRIKEILFTNDAIYVSYKDANGVEDTINIPKEEYMSITID